MDVKNGARFVEMMMNLNRIIDDSVRLMYRPKSSQKTNEGEK